MPLVIIDYLRENYTIDHGGFLRKYFKQDIRYAEGHVLEVYEGSIGKERVRVVNKRIVCIFDDKRVYLPRDDVLKIGISPHVWIVVSINRVGDPRRDLYYSIYPSRINVYVPWKSRFYARIEDLFFKSTGFKKHVASFIYRTSELFRELSEHRSEVSGKT